MVQVQRLCGTPAACWLHATVAQHPAGQHAVLTWTRQCCIKFHHRQSVHVMQLHHLLSTEAERETEMGTCSQSFELGLTP